MLKREKIACIYIAIHNNKSKRNIKKITKRIAMIIGVDIIPISNINIAYSIILKNIADVRNGKDKYRYSECFIKNLKLSRFPKFDREYYDQAYKLSFLVRKKGQSERFVINRKALKLCINNDDLNLVRRESHELLELLSNYLLEEDYIGIVERKAYIQNLLSIIYYIN